MDWTLFGAMVTGFFAIINPISTAPIFANVTAGNSPELRAQVARRAVAIAFGIIALFTVSGNLIFSLFGITLTAFRIVGGALVMIVGFEMVHGQPSQVQSPTNEDQEECRESQLSVAVSPLATPLIAGPGTISTAMGFAGDGNVVRVAMTLTAAAIICAVSLIAFLFSAADGVSGPERAERGEPADGAHHRRYRRADADDGYLCGDRRLCRLREVSG